AGPQPGKIEKPRFIWKNMGRGIHSPERESERRFDITTPQLGFGHQGERGMILRRLFQQLGELALGSFMIALEKRVSSLPARFAMQRLKRVEGLGFRSWGRDSTLFRKRSGRLEWRCASVFGHPRPGK